MRDAQGVALESAIVECVVRGVEAGGDCRKNGAFDPATMGPSPPPRATSRDDGGTRELER